MMKFIAFAVATAATFLFGQDGSKQQLVQFIQSPPPIREMVVECNWYAHAIGETNTNWIALCWQANAYIVRHSRQRSGQYDLFDTNKDELITIRAAAAHSTVSWYKNLGIHTKHVSGADSSARVSSAEKILESSWERDRVMPENPRTRNAGGACAGGWTARPGGSNRP